ncbi:DUF4189 domain-containing protein [Porphyrobacter sp. CACIAM 03H1]|uniref:DUF4189 domain-containing protein n=1 Tax=Porphyrobacter sp. CACIAM 03H1 TaxID=2003315 RepID=UPI000B5A7B8E|nr:DUF4189 domain-containing protein [Porphyrobacter sp. CACIAM 03H1]ASJ91957.1 hypothetical protein CBR61_14165 [Porphyrobacter sp. CACIAM 03H1]
MVGTTQSGNGVAGTPLCVIDGSAAPDSRAIRARVKAPPPPNGWEQRFGAFIWFPTWVGINQHSDGERYGYALVINYPTEADARKAALQQCLREVAPGKEQACTEGMITPISKPFFRIMFSPPRQFSMDEYTKLQALIDARQGFVFRSGGYVKCNVSAGTAAGCTDALLGLGRNGVHKQPLEPSARAFVACPAGPMGGEMKVVGSDGASGAPVPLCGPDWDVIEPRLHRDRYDGFAVHPLLKGPPFASGGHLDAATAEAAALALCSGVFGAGCRAMGFHVNGYSAVAVNDRGEMFLGKGDDRAGAIADAHRLCDRTPGQIIPCPVLSLRLAGAHGDQTATLYSNKAAFGAVAAPGGRVVQSGRAWFSRGMPSREEAERYALQHCAQANPSKAKCQIMGSGVSILMTSWVGLDGSAGVFVRYSESGNDRLDELLKAICASRGTLCKSTDSFSSDVMAPDVSTLRIGSFGGD